MKSQVHQGLTACPLAFDRPRVESHTLEMDSAFFKYKSFLCIDGPARKADKEYSKMKVCFVSRDYELLQSLLMRTAEDQECYTVKMSTKPKDGMYLGRCFFTKKEFAAKLWTKYKTHPKFMVTLQDDDFTEEYREAVISWKDKPENSLD